MKRYRFSSIYKHLIRQESTSTTLPSNILPCQRHLFDIPDNIHWFNCAYLTPGLKSQYEGGLYGLYRKLHPWKVIPPDDFFTDVDEFRLLISKLLHKKCKPKDISINCSASFGTAVIGKHLDKKINEYLSKKKTKLNIIVIKDQFPSNYYIWKELCNKYGNNKLELKIIDRENKFTSWTNNIISSIDENTILISVPNVHWSDSSLIDIEKISKYIIKEQLKPQCHLVLDVTQSLGAMPFPDKLDGVDYIVGALYKWLLGMIYIYFVGYINMMKKA